MRGTGERKGFPVLLFYKRFTICMEVLNENFICSQ